MKLQFLGSGSAFTTENYQSNMALHADNGNILLIDAGGDIRFSLKESGIKLSQITDIFISHLHGDHTGGLEFIGFATYFSRLRKPKLHISANLVHPLWENVLRGGMSSLQGMIANLDTYFEVCPVQANGGFVFEGIDVRLVRTMHVMDGFDFIQSYGIMYEIEGLKTFITTDTQHCPNQINDFYKMCDVVFHDCETFQFKSGVHAHYTDLITLPIETKNKLWLYHYQDGVLPDAIKDGFRGFVRKGQVFDYNLDYQSTFRSSIAEDT